MLQPFTQIQKLGQDNLDATMKALGAFSSTSQAIATEAAEFARKSFEHTSSTVEKLGGKLIIMASRALARVAKSLGFTTMSLYRYVASKDDLVTAMADRVLGRRSQPPDHARDWRARLEDASGLRQTGSALAASERDFCAHRTVDHDQDQVRSDGHPQQG